jgi:glycerol kinase
LTIGGGTTRSKILLRIIQDILATYIEREISEEQAGFGKGRGTRDQIANIRWILERTIEYGKTIIMCFIDYS